MHISRIILVFSGIFLTYLIFFNNDLDKNSITQLPIKKSIQSTEQTNIQKERKIAAIDITEKESPQAASQHQLKFNQLNNQEVVSFRPPGQESMLWQQSLITKQQLKFVDKKWSFFSNTLVKKIDQSTNLNRLHQSGQYQWVQEKFSLEDFDFESGYPALYNSKTRTLGMMNGNIIIQLKNNIQASDLTFEYKLNLVYEKNGLAIFSINQRKNLIELQYHLANDIRIEKFHFDISSQTVGLIH